MNVYLEGLGLGFSLIAAIGAQNAFVLRQGIKKEHAFAIAAICSIIDAALILAGAAGLGSIIASVPILLKVVTFFGATFVGWYGLQAFIRAFGSNSIMTENDGRKIPLKEAVTTILMLSLLNPHVYLDTVLLLGGVSSRYPMPTRLLFAAGASTASISWFFGLSFGAGFLAPLFSKKITWKIFDIAIGLIMAAIAYQLVLFGLRGA